jgi:hypothetical protein
MMLKNVEAPGGVVADPRASQDLVTSLYGPAVSHRLDIPSKRGNLP